MTKKHVVKGMKKNAQLYNSAVNTQTQETAAALQ